MKEQTARRIARWHVHRGDCTLFRRGAFSDSIWRQHFEWDRKRMHGRVHVPAAFEYQVPLIVDFLVKS